MADSDPSHRSAAVPVSVYLCVWCVLNLNGVMTVIGLGLWGSSAVHRDLKRCTPCIDVCMYTCMYVCMHVCMYVCMYVCM